MTRTRWIVSAVVALSAGLIAIVAASRPGARVHFGDPAPIGDGDVRSYVTLDARGVPTALGVSLAAAGLRRLPERMNTESRCFDRDGDGRHVRHECLGDYERILELPASVPASTMLPFRWIGLNWNPEGHLPPAPATYAEPHFDFHFYTVARERIEAIATGPCGELVDCGDFERGSRPVPAAYLPPAHIDVGAVVPRMGNHLMDSHSPELQDPPARFTRTFIYGAFDGELIFWEPMITLAFLRQATDECYPIRQPERYAAPGHYPTVYCVRYLSGEDRYTVSLERFVAAAGS